jgi:uncharacterized protein (DUF1501 family)
VLSRRDFLKDSLAVVSLGLGVPSVFGRAAVAAAAEGGSVRANGKTLIVVQLAGGVDPLNTVIPYSDGAYREFRPALGIPEQDMIVIDDRAAFHPSMGKLKDLWDRGRLAIVEGVGYPNPDFSHFKAMDIWQSGDPAGKTSDGWLGRYFAGLTDADGHPLAGLSVGRSLPSAFEAAGATIPSVENVESFGLQPAVGDEQPQKRDAALMKLYDVYRPANTPFAALLDTTLDSAVLSAKQLSQAHAAYQPAVTYPDSSLGSGLRLLAELIDSGEGESPLRVGHVTLGGFDTHTQQTGRLAALLTQTSEGLHAFWEDITAHGHAGDLLIMTWTEFGRRVRENAQEGTDHGAAGQMMFIGETVKPGFHGEPPSLVNLADGNLRFTTDFRSVYATVLEKWLEAPAKDVLGGHFPQIDLLGA